MAATGGSVEAAHRDIQRTRRLQTALAWCGPLFTVCLFGGWGLVGGFIPLIPAADSATDVAQAYAVHAQLHLVGLTLAMAGSFLTLPFSLAVSLQMRRAEQGIPMMAILQFGCGVIISVVLTVPLVFFIVGEFRPERPPELTRLVDDLAYVLLILPWPPVVGQLVALAVAVFGDRRPDPVFPRWVGYFSLWVGFLVLPASMIVFFKSGIFAWTGLVGFWIPAVAFGAWYLVMTWLLLRAVAAEAAEARTGLARASG